uniref:Serpin domain-containing protein n=1 Tax=Athene cunicularia TaxID=194338 RepID=A0A663MPC7_ATHCN
MGSLSAANAKFCLDFFKELRKVKINENIFFSPLSISAALSMVQLGARGNTAEEMEKVSFFPFPGNSGGAPSQFQELLVALGKAGATCSLSIANRLFGEETFQFLQVELEAVDFINAAEESRGKMNSWVEKQTGGKIKDLFPPGSIDSTTVLALVNAIHFKGVHGKSARNFKQDDPVVFIACFILPVFFFWLLFPLPYNGEELSMFILLPENICDESTGLEQLESAITYEKLAEWTNMENVYLQEITVYLPRFRMKESYELTAVLKALGMRDAFILEQADFSGISTEPGLFLSRVIHKSFVEINEEGTEAAAATGMIVFASSFHIPYEFRTDHPFLFLIKHNPSKNILFFGRCCSP